MLTFGSARGALITTLSAAALLNSCVESVHQVVLIVDTELCEPGDGSSPDFDRVTITVEGADPVCAVFGDADDTGCIGVTSNDFPLVLPILSESGEGTATVNVEFRDGEEVVGCGTGSVAFAVDQTRFARIFVPRPCGDASCEDALTLLPSDTDPDALSAQACVTPSAQPQEPIRRIAAGGQHACMVDDRGEIYCWGKNSSRQVGLRDVETQPRPVRIETTGFVLDADCGGSHTCAVILDGENRQIRCWGLGANGQLGNGMSPPTPSPNPIIVRNSDNAWSVSLGPFHSCGIFGPNGEVKCWGGNIRGEVNGSPGPDRNTPVLVTLPLTDPVPKATQVATGGSSADPIRHSCANTDQGVFCWGDDSVGQLGGPGEGPAPVAIEGLTGVTQIAAGTRDTCAVDGAGQIYCWGSNQDPGTLGIDTGGPKDLLVPTEIDTPTDVLPRPTPAVGPPLSTLDSGDNFHCYIDVGGRVFCFGSNARERLGSPGTSTIVPREVELPESVTFSQVVTGTNFACALPADGGLPYCWGDNLQGQLGRGTSEGSGLPVQIRACR